MSCVWRATYRAFQNPRVLQSTYTYIVGVGGGPCAPLLRQGQAYLQA